MNEFSVINSLGFDGKIKKSWKAELVSQDQDLLVFRGVFDKEIHHAELGVIRRGTISDEYYWLNRWYNIFKFHQPDGTFRNFYCNINMPPIFQNGVLDYVDLDIDVLVAPDLSWKILDMDDFEINAIKFGYPLDVVLKAKTTLDEVISLIEKREFPFHI